MNEETKLKLSKYGIYSMILAALVFIIGNTIAILLYPHYSLTNNFFSDLGIRKEAVVGSENTVVKAAPYPEIFNITLYITGLLLLPFFTSAYLILSSNKKGDIFFILAAISGFSMGPLMIGVGIFDVGTKFDNHVMFATDLMLMIGMTSLLWSIGVIFLDNSSKYKTKYHWKSDPIFVIFIIIVSWVLVFGRPNIIILKSISYPIYQKMVALSFIPYYSIVSIRLLKILNN